MKRPFSETQITVTLKGKEWVTLLARMLRRELSKEGEATYHAASTKLQKQLLGAQTDHNKEQTQ